MLDAEADELPQGSEHADILKYVTDGDYTNTIVHRSVPGFIIQGGGFIINHLLCRLSPPARKTGRKDDALAAAARTRGGGQPMT